MPCKPLAFALALALSPLCAGAQTIGVAVDAKVILRNGEGAIPDQPAADSAAFFRLEHGQLRKLGEVAVPTSYLGPPTSIAVSPRGDLALVAASTRLDPADPKRYAADDRLSVVDLSGKTPKLVQTLALGVRPSSVKFDRSGTTALVSSNPDNGFVYLSIDKRRAAIAGKLTLAPNTGPLSSAFAPDGKRLLVAQPDAQRVSLYDWRDGRIVQPAVRDMVAGVTPFTVAYCGADLAVVGNFGIPDNGNGDIDTVSLIDLAGARPRVIDTVAVGSAPEDVACSPDGRFAAAAVQNMSNRPASHPWHSPHSLVVLLKIEDRRLRRVAAAPIGAWAEGVAFGDDNATVLAQSIDDRALHVLRIEGDTLKPAGAPVVFENGAPAAIGVAGR
ncbi:YncE family protein [Lysobacter enzymogenes]|uniref:YncE family protein n=1 Tax=Lysobacter enzymogenes TaxID=69 RepID=UPI001A95B9D2|nr:YncE family protein [Lysobacter enzymogenes]QQP94129.1 YncE family protein [Lysobacter enzymogenes]